MKTGKGRKMLAGLLSCAVACSLVCGAVPAMAAEAGEVQQMPEDAAVFPQWEDAREEDVAETGGTTEDGFKWSVLEDGTAEITRYNGSAVSVAIPESVEGYTVTSIGRNAFHGRSELEAVTIPESVTNIGYASFRKCSRLETVTIPTGVTQIDDFAFDDCSGLKEITIPENVAYVGYYAFSDCVSLEKIEVAGGNTVYDSRDNCNAIIRDDVLVTGCKNTVIPKGVTAIRNIAFMGCSGLEEITIPEGVTDIGQYAFWGCSSLKALEIPASVTIIRDEAFCYCTGLEKIEVAEGNTVYDSRDDCNAIIRDGVLMTGCKNTVIPKGVTEIGQNAFKGSSGPEKLAIPEGVVKIGSDVFYECSGVKEIMVSASVTSISDTALGYCTSLEKIKVAEGNAIYDSRDNCNAIISGTELVAGCKNTVIPLGVTRIGERAFSGHSGLKTITIPEGVTSIGIYAFNNCGGLEAVTIPSSVTNIEGSAFCNCIGLKTITIPENMAEIGNFAFLGCSGLKTITIPESVTKIGYYAFYECSGLETVTILSSTAEIDSDAFDRFPRFILYGYSGSTAETYAKENRYITFVSLGDPPHTHTYGSPSFTWSSDFTTCTAVFTCTDGDGSTEPQSAVVTSAVTTAATCAAEGVMTYTAKLTFGGQEYTDTKTQPIVKLTDHTWDAGTVTTAATCAVEGVKTYTCTVCKAATKTESLPKSAHAYVNKLEKATDKKDGRIADVCSVCGAVANGTAISRVEKTVLAATRYTYDGKAKKPAVMVTDAAGAKLKNGTDYSVSYKDNKKAGIAIATVTLKGNYEGTITKTFEIVPKATTISKLSAAKKGFKVTWKKQATETNGYEIAYSTSSKFTAKTTKTATVGKKTTTSKSVTKLAAKKKYYVRIRTYKTVKVGGKPQKVYSDWSKVKNVTTK